MFGEQAFRSWPHVLAGGAVFAGLFALVALLMEQLFEGTFQVSRWVVVFGAAAFAGYVGVALLVRYDQPPGRDE